MSVFTKVLAVVKRQSTGMEAPAEKLKTLPPFLKNTLKNRVHVPPFIRVFTRKKLLLTRTVCSYPRFPDAIRLETDHTQAV